MPHVRQLQSLELFEVLVKFDGCARPLDGGLLDKPHFEVFNLTSSSQRVIKDLNHHSAIR